MLSEDILDILYPVQTKNKRCLPGHGYTATAYCRDGIKGTDGSWLKTTNSRPKWSWFAEVELGWDWYNGEWKNLELTPIYMEGYYVKFWFPSKSSRRCCYHWPEEEGDNMEDLIVQPILSKSWTKPAIKRFTDIYRYTECESYNKNPYPYKLIGFEEIRKLKCKKPNNWERECKKNEKKFLEKINESILKRKNKICGNQNHTGGRCLRFRPLPLRYLLSSAI